MEESMKIGFLLPSIYMSDRFGKGRIFAPGVIGKTLVGGLVKKGHEVFFYTAWGVRSKATVVAGDEALLQRDLFYYLFRNRSEEEKKYTTIEIQKRDFEYALTLKAYQDGLKGRIDIMHSYHDFGAHYFHELTGFPTVYTLHDPMPVDDTTVEYHRLKRFSNHPYVSISNAQRKDFPINFAGNVYHGINLNDYEFGEGKGNYLIHFGRILEDKGTHVAIEVAKRIGMPLRIASSGIRANTSQQYYEEKVKPSIDGVTVSEVGFQEGEEKLGYIKNAVAFLFPLQWEEPFGLVMVEAMACGTPVIAYNRGSVFEIVRDGLTGFIIEPEDSTGNSQWIIKKKGADGLVEAVSRIGQIDRKACRRQVEEHFTVEKMVQGYEDVYKKVLSSH